MGQKAETAPSSIPGSQQKKKKKKKQMSMIVQSQTQTQQPQTLMKGGKQSTQKLKFVVPQINTQYVTQMSQNSQKASQPGMNLKIGTHPNSCCSTQRYNVSSKASTCRKVQYDEESLNANNENRSQNQPQQQFIFTGKYDKDHSNLKQQKSSALIMINSPNQSRQVSNTQVQSPNNVQLKFNQELYYTNKSGSSQMTSQQMKKPPIQIQTQNLNIKSQTSIQSPINMNNKLTSSNEPNEDQSKVSFHKKSNSQHMIQQKSNSKKKPQIQRSFLEDQYQDNSNGIYKEISPNNDTDEFLKVNEYDKKVQNQDILSESQEDLLAYYYQQFKVKRKSQDSTANHRNYQNQLQIMDSLENQKNYNLMSQEKILPKGDNINIKQINDFSNYKNTQHKRSQTNRGAQQYQNGSTVSLIQKPYIMSQESQSKIQVANFITQNSQKQTSGIIQHQQSKHSFLSAYNQTSQQSHMQNKSIDDNIAFNALSQQNENLTLRVQMMKVKQDRDQKKINDEEERVRIKQQIYHNLVQENIKQDNDANNYNQRDQNLSQMSNLMITPSRIEEKDSILSTQYLNKVEIPRFNCNGGIDSYPSVLMQTTTQNNTNGQQLTHDEMFMMPIQQQLMTKQILGPTDLMYDNKNVGSGAILNCQKKSNVNSYKEQACNYDFVFETNNQIQNLYQPASSNYNNKDNSIVNLVESFDVSLVYDKRISRLGDNSQVKNEASFLDISTGNSQSDMMLLSALKKQLGNYEQKNISLPPTQKKSVKQMQPVIEKSQIATITENEMTEDDINERSRVDDEKGKNIGPRPKSTLKFQPLNEKKFTNNESCIATSQYDKCFSPFQKTSGVGINNFQMKKFSIDPKTTQLLQNGFNNNFSDLKQNQNMNQAFQNFTSQNKAGLNKQLVNKNAKTTLGGNIRNNSKFKK